MNEYYFLFALALVYLIFASIQDLKKREVANWLSFSLIAFALAYRIVYSSATGNWMFILYGLAGFALCFVIANAFYYSKVFAGGDAKLLMGIGAILPYVGWTDVLFKVLVFVFVLFAVGAVYSLVYSVYIVSQNMKKFVIKFKFYWKKLYILLFVSIIFFILFDLVFKSFQFAIYFGLFALFVAFLFIYLKALDECMIVKVSAGKLTEGDWILSDIKVGNRIIRKTVHGLSWKDIKLLRQYGKSIDVKQGVPFVPAFLIAFAIMLFFLEVLKFDLVAFLLSLF
ncbi:MAG: prepilin peptidase [archaeon]